MSSEHEAAGGLAVEAVRQRGVAGQPEPQRVEVVLEARAPFGPAVNRDPRRLVDDQHQSVAVEEPRSCFFGRHGDIGNQQRRARIGAAGRKRIARCGEALAPPPCRRVVPTRLHAKTGRRPPRRAAERLPRVDHFCVPLGERNGCVERRRRQDRETRLHAPVVRRDACAGIGTHAGGYALRRRCVARRRARDRGPTRRRGGSRDAPDRRAERAGAAGCRRPLPSGRSRRSPRPRPVEISAEPTPESRWFGRLRAGLSRSSTSIGRGVTDIFTKRKLDAESLDDLEDVLIQADLGLARRDAHPRGDRARALREGHRPGSREGGAGGRGRARARAGRPPAGRRPGEAAVRHSGRRRQRLGQDDDHRQAGRQVRGRRQDDRARGRRHVPRRRDRAGARLGAAYRLRPRRARSGRRTPPASPSTR